MPRRTSIQDVLVTILRAPAGRVQPRRYDARILEEPRVGRPLIMYSAENRRIVTTLVVRVFGDAGTGERYVQTRNTLYRLETSTRPPEMAASSTSAAVQQL